VDEKEQRWGSRTIEGSGRLDSVNIDKLREQVKQDDRDNQQIEHHSSLKGSAGYGGKFGVQQDRVDKVNFGCGRAESLVIISNNLKSLIFLLLLVGRRI
jgi:cortactin